MRHAPERWRNSNIDVTTTTPRLSPQVYCSAMSQDCCTRATPRWQSAGHPYCRWTASYCAINLLGQVDPGELLDPQVIRQVEEELQRLAPGRRAKGEEGLFDLLRELGPTGGRTQRNGIQAAVKRLRRI